MDDKTAISRIGDALRARRIELGFSQESFADSIGMHRAYYSSIERGGRNVTLLTLLRIVQGLKLRASNLMESCDL